MPRILLAALALAVCTATVAVRAAPADPAHATPADPMHATPADAAHAAPADAAPAEQAADPRAALLKRLPPGSKLEDLRPSPIAGIYEFAQGADVSYITADDKYSFTVISMTGIHARI